MIPIVDSDSIVYRAAMGCKYDLIQALDYSNFILDKIWDRFNSKPVLFLSGTTNFRYSVDPTYKEHRKKLEKPRFYHAIRDYFVSDWQAEIIEWYEADDKVGVMASPFSVMCSIDKDLNTIPGFHFNYQTDELYEVSEEQAAWYFWKQVLAGDSVDNVQGIKGIGEKKAVKLLEGLDVKDYKKAVLDAYLRDEKKRQDRAILLEKDYIPYSEKELEDRAFEAFDRTARLIFIKRGSLESEYYDYY